MKWFLIACLSLISGNAFLQDKDPDLFTTTYVVGSDFLEKIQEADAAPIDVTKHFKNQGIPFLPGGVVMYYPTKSQLMVRNAEEEMKLVSEFIDTFNSGVEMQAYITVKEFVISEEEAGKAEFDWLLIPAAPPEHVSASSSSTSNSRESFLEELSRPPTLPDEEGAPKEKPTRGITGVFTDPQFQVVIRALSSNGKGDMLSTPSVMTRSNQPALIQVGEKRWGVIPVIGSDGFTLDLELFSPSHGKPLNHKERQPESLARVTIWDGQTVAWSEKIDDENYRTVFLKAQLMDPAGMPINEQSGAPIDPSDAPKIEELQGSNEKYEVQKGDTLHSIARRSGLSVRKLSDANFFIFQRHQRRAEADHPGAITREPVPALPARG